MRNILIYSTKGTRKQTIESAATTWGELQNQLAEMDFDFDGLKAIVADTQNTLESVEAKLPEGAFTLMFIVSKVKSGGDYDSMTYNELRRMVSERGLSSGTGSSPSKQTLISILEEDDHYEENFEENEDFSVDVHEIENIVEDLVELNTKEKFELALSLLSQVKEEIFSTSARTGLNPSIDEETERLAQLANQIANNIF